MRAKNKKYQRIAYYPGCALDGSGHPYNRSTKAVGKALGLELDEVKNWNCCGAMEVKNIDPKLQTYLSSRVMSIASQEMGHDVQVVPEYSMGSMQGILRNPETGTLMAGADPRRMMYAVGW